MRAVLAVFAVFAVSASAGSVSAQSGPAPQVRAVSYGEALRTNRFLRIEGQQRGVPAYFFAHSENPNMPSGFRVEEFYAYGPWQVCEGNRFSGRCTVVQGK